MQSASGGVVLWCKTKCAYENEKKREGGRGLTKLFQNQVLQHDLAVIVYARKHEKNIHILFFLLHRTTRRTQAFYVFMWIFKESRKRLLE